MPDILLIDIENKPGIVFESAGKKYDHKANILIKVVYFLLTCLRLSQMYVKYNYAKQILEIHVFVMK